MSYTSWAENYIIAREKEYMSRQILLADGIFFLAAAEMYQWVLY